MAALEDLKAFDVQASDTTLWVFKKSNSNERGLRFSGYWIETTVDLDTALKGAVLHERDRITEVQEYGLLTQPNEASALTITTLETNAGLITDAASEELQSRKVKKSKKLITRSFMPLNL